MADKKNLDIKVKYPNRVNEAATPVPKMVTVWHMPRIITAAGILIGLLLLLSVWLMQGQGKNKSIVDKDAVTTAQTTDQASSQATAASTLSVSKEASITARSADKSSSRVRRALFTTGIRNKEPVGPVPSTLQVKPEKSITLYFFTELRGMNGKTVYHEWWHNGTAMLKETFIVAAERWRVASQIRLDPHSAGDWTAKLLDANGRVLNAQSVAVTVEP